MRPTHLVTAASGLFVLASGCSLLTDFDGLAGTTGGATTSTAGHGGSAGNGAYGGGTTSTGGTDQAGHGGTGGGGAAATGGGGAGGAGGAEGGAPGYDVMVINELVSDPVGSGTDWVEFYNRGAADLDISGFYFTDADAGHVYTFPGGTLLSANGYIVRVELTDFNFGLSKDADEVHLYNFAGTQLDSTSWTAPQGAEPNSWGRSPNGSGNFTTLSPTPGAANP